jgi:hypothetical protein
MLRSNKNFYSAEVFEAMTASTSAFVAEFSCCAHMISTPPVSNSLIINKLYCFYSRAHCVTLCCVP